MSLAPKFAGQRWTASSTAQAAVHTIELYLDYVCPFSAKMFKTLYKTVLPSIGSKPYGKNVQFIFRQQIQPWHPSSTLVHETGAAVLRAAPNKFWDFSEALFEQQAEYFDVNVKDESRNATYKRLAKLASSTTGIDEARFLELLIIKASDDESLNVGNGVTDDIKFLVKANRLTGVHVTPTVLFNGVVENGISSSFTSEQWDQWLSENVSSGPPSSL